MEFHESGQSAPGLCFACMAAVLRRIGQAKGRAIDPKQPSASAKRARIFFFFGHGTENQREQLLKDSSRQGATSLRQSALTELHPGHKSKILPKGTHDIEDRKSTRLNSS